MAVKIKQMTNCKIAGNDIVLIKISNEPHKNFLVTNKKGEQIGNISNAFGWNFCAYNNLGEKLEMWMSNRYKSEDYVLKFLIEFWI